MEKKEIVIIGVGRYSYALIENLRKMNKFSIVAIDKSEEALTKIKGVKSLIVGDATNEEFMKSIGIENAGYYIIGIGSDFQSSLSIATILKNSFKGTVFAKAINNEHVAILNKIGVEEVVKPEESAAKGTFNKIANPFSLKSESEGEVIEIADGVSTIKIPVPPSLFGVMIKNSKLPSEIIIPIIYRDGKLFIATGKTLLKEGDYFSIIGENKILAKFLSRVYKEIKDNE